MIKPHVTTNAPKTAAIVLAAGKGTRMKSQLPKVLHPLLGRPMITYPVQAALDAGADHVVVVVGHGAKDVTRVLNAHFGTHVTTALQSEQRGTGDAARCGAEEMANFQGRFLVLNGDAPLLTAATLARLGDATIKQNAALGLLVSDAEDATGYGRILRNRDGQVLGIREEKDCSEAERQIREWNPGVYAVDANFFRAQIRGLTTNNAQGELLLTDLVARAAALGPVADVRWPQSDLHGVNDRVELVACEGVLRERINRFHARAGATLRDPQSTFIDADVTVGMDVVIEGQVHLRGRCQIGNRVRIDTGCVLTNMTIAEGVTLLPYTVASDSQIGADAQVGPFSHLRPGTQLAEQSHVGNFVELKKTIVGKGSKANHLSYLGDGIIGEGVNIGAGTIFCNYDSVNKHQTVLEDGVFIGSDSQLVAPVKIGKNAYVATGTTVTHDVPRDALAIGRVRQVNKEGMAARLRAKLLAAKNAGIKSK